MRACVRACVRACLQMIRSSDYLVAAILVFSNSCSDQPDAPKNRRKFRKVGVVPREFLDFVSGIFGPQNNLHDTSNN